MPKRLEKARELGASEVININEQDTIEAVKALTGGRGCDLVIEAGGVESAARQSVSITRKGAVIVMAGYGKTGMINLPMSLAMDKSAADKANIVKSVVRIG
jgi:L-iditol 2-dehydrogenase